MLPHLASRRPVNRQPDDDELADLAGRARTYLQLLESMQRANAPAAPSPRPAPSPRLQSPRTARADLRATNAPLAATAANASTLSPRPAAADEAPKDEMEKLLQKYELAKEKLQALELMYPN